MATKARSGPATTPAIQAFDELELVGVSVAKGSSCASGSVLDADPEVSVVVEVLCSQSLDELTGPMVDDPVVGGPVVGSNCLTVGTMVADTVSPTVSVKVPSVLVTVVFRVIYTSVSTCK